MYNGKDSSITDVVCGRRHNTASRGTFGLPSTTGDRAPRDSKIATIEPKSGMRQSKRGAGGAGPASAQNRRRGAFGLSGTNQGTRFASERTLAHSTGLRP